MAVWSLPLSILVALVLAGCSSMRDIEWDGMYFGAKHVTDSGLRYFDYDVEEGGPDVEVRLPDGSFVRPANFRLGQAMAMLKKDTRTEPPPYPTPMSNVTEYYRGSRYVGRRTQYLHDDIQRDSIIISLSYRPEVSGTFYFSQKSGRLSRMMIHAYPSRQIEARVTPAIRSPRSGEILTFPVSESDLKRLFGEPN